MAKGCLICAGIQLCGFLVLHVLGILPFTYRILLSTAIGTCVSLLSFTVLCLSVQKAAGMNDQKAMKAQMQLSYNARLFLQAGWVVAAFLLPFFTVIAAAVPLLYPTVIILFLQKKGVLVEPSTRKNPESSEEEDHLESFEV